MRIYTSIVIIFIFFNLFGQKDTISIVDSNRVKKQSTSTKNKHENLYSSQVRIDSIIGVILSEQSQLKQKNDILRTTLESNTNIFNGISSFFAIISILLTIVVIAIPLINYFLVLKPNKKIVDKVKNLEEDVLKTLEGNFENYFEKLRKQKTTKILNLLNDRLRLSEVTNYFVLNDTDNLEEEDIAKIIDFLDENDDIEEIDASILHSIVIESDFFIAEKYYKSIFEKDEENKYEFAVKYLVDNDFENHISYIEKIIKANDKGHHLLIRFFEYIKNNFIGNLMEKKVSEKKEIGVKYIRLLFDNVKILNSIKDKEIPKTSGFEEHPISRNILNHNPFLRETNYYEEYLKGLDT